MHHVVQRRLENHVCCAASAWVKTLHADKRTGMIWFTSSSHIMSTFCILKADQDDWEANNSVIYYMVVV